MTVKQHFMSTNNAIVAPTGLVMFLETGANLPSNWSTISSSYNSRCIKISETTTPLTMRSAASMYHESSTWGGHVQNDTNVRGYGYDGSANGGSTGYPSADPNLQGSHRHAAYSYFTPARAHAIMIISSDGALIEQGIIGLAEADLSANHTPFTQWTNDGVLTTYSSTGNASQAASMTVSNQYYTHNHRRTNTKNMEYYGTIAKTAARSQTSDYHSHSAYISMTTGVTDSLYYFYARAYKVLNPGNITGIMGLYTGTTIPDGWELVAAADEHYIKINSSATGTTSGDGTLELVDDASGAHAHLHDFDSGSQVTNSYSKVSHNDNHYHTHSLTHTATNYNHSDIIFKLIKYTG